MTDARPRLGLSEREIKELLYPRTGNVQASVRKIFLGLVGLTPDWRKHDEG